MRHIFRPRDFKFHGNEVQGTYFKSEFWKKSHSFLLFPAAPSLKFLPRAIHLPQVKHLPTHSLKYISSSFSVQLDKFCNQGMRVQGSWQGLKATLFWHQKTFKKQKSRRVLHQTPQAPILKSNPFNYAPPIYQRISQSQITKMITSIVSITTLVLQD